MAIFLDIYRLVILVIQLKSIEDDLIYRIKMCQIILAIWFFVFFVIIGYRYYELYENTLDHDVEDPPNIWYAVVYTYIYNFTMIGAYFYLYFTLKRAYLQVKLNFAEDLSKREKKQIDENLCSLLILYIAIIQICIYRIVFETYN